jgi:hypothetical protein
VGGVAQDIATGRFRPFFFRCGMTADSPIYSIHTFFLFFTKMILVVVVVIYS